MHGGVRLARRTVAVSIMLCAVIGTVFALLLIADREVDDAVSQAGHSQRVLRAADRLEIQLLDVETGVQGFVITGQPQFLQPWQAGRSGFPAQASELERAAAASTALQEARAHRIAAVGAAYINGYTVPLVATASRDLAAARTVEQTATGKQQVDLLRNQFTVLKAAQRQLLAASQARAKAAGDRAVVTAAVAIPLSIIVILLGGGYLAVRVVRPVRRAAMMASQVAEGDLTVRMGEDGPGEVGTLERAFNAMTRSLGTSRDELSQALEEQEALWRVAGLVARGVPQDEVFHAVAAQTGSALGAERAAVVRYDPDRVATVVGTWGRRGSAGPALGSRWPVADSSNLGLILRTHAPARVTSYQDVPGQLSAWARKQGVRWSVGTPIAVEDATWGLAIIFSGSGDPPARAEERMLAFTELATMAISNADSRAKLAASRARLVAAGDEARRRVERDLHDGAQQRLITLALELRAAAERLPAGNDWIAQQWSRAAEELRNVTDDLREISRGLHPVTLEKGGLAPALRTLARRSAVRTELNVNVGGRLPEPVEAAGYYVVSEALTNVVKHAHATTVRIDADVEDNDLRLVVTDDGTGGADVSRGSGLVGLSDRVEALGGRIDLTSPTGGGTSIAVTIPLGSTLTRSINM